jgi:hypothetical protein
MSVVFFYNSSPYLCVVKENEMESQKIKKQDWENVLRIMLKYSRQNGYVDLVGGSFLFFDSDPKIDGVGACFVTIENVKSYINSY